MNVIVNRSDKKKSAILNTCKLKITVFSPPKGLKLYPGWITETIWFEEALVRRSSKLPLSALLKIKLTRVKINRIPKADPIRLPGTVSLF